MGSTPLTVSGQESALGNDIADAGNGLRQARAMEREPGSTAAAAGRFPPLDG
uniref:Uncharacterized protein n=1 Tax=Arundo donax TaxID=35708 RepID=A0A0A9HZM2_ARUDO